MQLFYPDYIKLVIAAYKRKQKDSELSPLLTTFTRASIRQECLNVYTERLKKGEREEISTLRAFFGVPNEGKGFSSLIERSDLDKFRPLENLMKNKIQNPGLATVELLAWLIDFKHRPYAAGMNVLLDGDEVDSLDKAVINPGNSRGTKEPEEGRKGEEATLENEKGNKEGGKVKPAIAILLMAATFIGVYVIWQREGSRQMSFGKVNTGCMYWADDHYEQVPCNEERKGRLILPLNVEKMKSFKRITREDTITERSIGKVYYIKNSGVIEYYTADGNHPVEVTRSLKPLSRYMFDKYLGKQGIANKNFASEDAR